MAVLTALLMAACSKDELSGFLSDPDAVRIEAAVGALTKSNPLGDAEAQKTFNDKDRIAVTNAGKTVVYVLENGTWAPETKGEYLKWDKTDLKFTAKYPADYTALPAEQNTKEKLTSADYMEGAVDYSDAGIPSDRILSIGLERKNVLVRIKIKSYNDQYDKDVNKINFVTIGEGSVWGGSDRLDMVSKPLVQSEDGTIKDETFSEGTIGYTYSGIVLSNDSRRNDLRFIRLQVAGTPLPAELEVRGVPVLEAGHAYTFDLIIGKNSATIGSVNVNEWGTGATISDGETDPVDTWDGKTVTAFATKDADGNELGNTEENPILISSCAQLAYLSEHVKNGEKYENTYFKLTDDLNLAGKSWRPIGYKSASGTSDTPFCGTFDGDRHEIMGLRVDANSNCLGLFGYIKSTYLKNLKISSADINSTGDYAAILCGYAEEANISNCSVSGKVKIEHTTAGGLVAYLKNSNMSNCTAEVEVTSQHNVGGLCGKIDCGIIEKCTVLPGSSTMAVIPNSYNPNMGGLIGYIGSDGNDVSQIGYCNTYAKVSGFGNVGGAIGYVDADNSHQIGECTVYGDVSVSLPSGKTNFGIGGFVGILKYKTGKPEFSKCGFNGTITNADGTSLAKGSIYGAFVGVDDSNATFTGCWYYSDKTGELSSVGTGVKDKDYKGIEAKNSRR